MGVGGYFGDTPPLGWVKACESPELSYVVKSYFSAHDFIKKAADPRMVVCPQLCAWHVVFGFLLASQFVFVAGVHQQRVKGLRNFIHELRLVHSLCGSLLAGKGLNQWNHFGPEKNHRFRDSCSDISIINVYVYIYIHIYIYIHTYPCVCVYIYIYTRYIFFVCLLIVVSKVHRSI